MPCEKIFPAWKTLITIHRRQDFIRTRMNLHVSIGGYVPVIAAIYA